MKLYCATTNSGKLREFRLAVEGFGRGAIAVDPLPGLRELPPSPEEGATFEENAIQKAIYYSQRSAGLLFADDSGLAVDALGGAPGVESARFAGLGASDEDNNQLLVERMRGAKDRSARFVCVIALARHGELAAAFRGEVQGVLLEEPRGSGGFGYDPLFYYAPFGCTLAEVSAEQKIEVSHRGQALRAMVEYLLNIAREGI